MKAIRALTESSAAFADLGTFLPLVVGLIVLAGVDPIGLLYGFGLFALQLIEIPRPQDRRSGGVGVGGFVAKNKRCHAGDPWYWMCSRAL